MAALVHDDDAVSPSPIASSLVVGLMLTRCGSRRLAVRAAHAVRRNIQAAKIPKIRRPRPRAHPIRKAFGVRRTDGAAEGADPLAGRRRRARRPGDPADGPISEKSRRFVDAFFLISGARGSFWTAQAEKPIFWRTFMLRIERKQLENTNAISRARRRLPARGRLRPVKAGCARRSGGSRPGDHPQSRGLGPQA